MRGRAESRSQLQVTLSKQSDKTAEGASPPPLPSLLPFHITGSHSPNHDPTHRLLQYTAFFPSNLIASPYAAIAAG